MHMNNDPSRCPGEVNEVHHKIRIEAVTGEGLQSWREWCEGGGGHACPSERLGWGRQRRIRQLGKPISLYYRKV